MATGIQKTWNVLAQTSNRAAVPVLVAALRSPHADIHASAVRALIRRRDAASHEPLIRQFAKFDAAEQAMLRDAIREMPRRLRPALTRAVLDGDAVMCEHACNIILLSRDYGLFSVLIKAAEDLRHRHREQVAAALIRLACLLHQDATAKTSGDGRPNRDTFFVRRQVVAALEKSLSRFTTHERQEILEAFLTLAPPDNTTLLRILRDEMHACHARVTSSLRTSKAPGVLERLIGFLQMNDAPAVAMTVLARRTDHRFVEALLHGLKQPISLVALDNLRRMRSVSWLEESRQVLLELDGEAQALAVELAIASGISRQAVFELIADILRDGQAGGRRAACRALGGFHRPQVNELAFAAMSDRDPEVQIEAARLLRRRSQNRIADAEIMNFEFDPQSDVSISKSSQSRYPGDQSAR